METLTAKEARILGLLVKYEGNWKKVAAQFSMSEADFKVALVVKLVDTKDLKHNQYRE